MKYDLKEHSLKLYSMFLLMLAAFIVATGYYVNSIQGYLSLDSKTNFAEIMSKSSQLVSSKLDNKFDILATLARDIAEAEKISNEQMMQLLLQKQQDSDALRFGYADLKGNAVTSDRQVFEVADRSYFQESVLGNPQISERLYDVTGVFKQIIVFSVPVYNPDTGNIKGVLFAVYEPAILQNILSVNFFNMDISAYIISDRGQLVVQPPNQDSKRVDALFASKSFKQQLNLKNKNTQMFNYEIAGKRNLVVRSAMHDNIPNFSWGLLAIFPEELIFVQANKIIGQTVMLLLVVFVIFAVGVLHIFKIKERNSRMLEFVAYQDELCEIYNNKGFVREGHKYENNMSQGTIAIVYLDVDNFKIINDMFGYEYGDLLLHNIADKLKQVFPKAVLGRLTADHFAILTHYGNEQSLFDNINTLLDEVQSHYVNKYAIKLSVGIYLPSKNSQELISDMLNKANLARKSVKNMDKVRYLVYNNVTEEKVREKAWLAEELKLAIANNDFVVYYQPKINLSTRKTIASEALVRWIHPQRGMINPGDFIALAEERQLIADISRIVFEKVCIDMARWQAMGIEVLPVSVNLSRLDFYQEGLIDFLVSTMEKYHIKPSLMEFEITETVIVNDYEYIKQSVEHLRSLGVLISIDDFGTGYSSFASLGILPVDIVKIDRAILVNAMENSKSLNILKAIIALGLDLGLQLICEGIETEEQTELLIEFKCGMGQGYLFNKPMPAGKFEELLLSMKKNN